MDKVEFDVDLQGHIDLLADAVKGFISDLPFEAPEEIEPVIAYNRWLLARTAELFDNFESIWHKIRTLCKSQTPSEARFSDLARIYLDLLIRSYNQLCEVGPVKISPDRLVGKRGPLPMAGKRDEMPKDRES